MNNNEKPVFEFLGYSLLDCKYHRDFDSGRPNKLFIIVSNYGKQNNSIFNLQIDVRITFDNDSESTFSYHSQFKINDEEAFNNINEQYQNLGISNMFSIVFPYIRASISLMTNDSLQQILLPIINALKGDITKGVSFTSYTQKK